MSRADDPDPTPRGRARRLPTPLDRAGLDALAIAYAARYATSEARLAAYLERKLRSRGWAGDGPAPVAAIVARCAELGYVDDRGFAEVRARSLAARGYGSRRIGAALRAAGISAEAGAEAVEARSGEAEALDAARRFARRRRLGPWRSGGSARAHGRESDSKVEQREMAAMLRAGHEASIARRVLRGPAGDSE